MILPLVHVGHFDVQNTAELSVSACHVCLRYLCNVLLSHRATAGPPSRLQGVLAVSASMHAVNASLQAGIWTSKWYFSHITGKVFYNLTVMKVVSCTTQILSWIQINRWIKVGWSLILLAVPLAQSTHLPRWREMAGNRTKHSQGVNLSDSNPVCCKDILSSQTLPENCAEQVYMWRWKLMVYCNWEDCVVLIKKLWHVPDMRVPRYIF